MTTNIEAGHLPGIVCPLCCDWTSDDEPSMAELALVASLTTHNARRWPDDEAVERLCLHLLAEHDAKVHRDPRVWTAAPERWERLFGRLDDELGDDGAGDR